MKIHSVIIRNVRQLREADLDLSAPLTLIGGPNGVGKSTVQQAILAAMFYTEKKARDSLISRFDPHTPPTVVLGLSRGESTATIVLTRNVSDDKGEWSEGTSIIKKKGQALKEVQRVFPISADAAALLLWGRQDEMTAIIDGFPSDGHSLLTAAAIRGSGPDPKEIIRALEKESEEARRGEKGGQVVGALTQARKRFDDLTRALEQARAAEADLKNRRAQWDQARNEREQAKLRFKELETDVARLEKLDKLLEAALHDSATLVQLDETQTEWAGLERDIEDAARTLADLSRDVDQLRSQYRVARDQELGRQIEKLRAKISLVEELERAGADLEKELKARKRPDPADVKKLQELRGRAKEAQDKMEASGVRYELAATKETRTVRVAEDDAPPQEIVLSAGRPHQGIVGRLAIDADGLRFTAAGKEDISSHKRTLAASTGEIQALFDRFEVDSDAVFLSRAAEKQELAGKLKEKSNALKMQLGGSTRAALADELAFLDKARSEVGLTLADREAWSGQILPAAADMNRWCGQKEGEINQARENLALLEQKHPSETARALFTANLETIRKKARDSAAAFKDADAQGRDPSPDLHKALKDTLARKRAEQATLARTLMDIERRAGELEGQLKQACPHRPLDLIENDKAEAETFYQREQVFQQARALLIDRIERKMDELAGHVPVELGNRVTEHLAQLTGGAFSRVQLARELGVAHVGENGDQSALWQPGELSHGERHQAALAVKIAVARALAETTGPVFIMLDDSLVTFDPERRSTTERAFLDLVADEKLQIILFTCHTDWAADWKRRQPELVSYIELAKAAKYYRSPPGLTARKEPVGVLCT